MLVTMGLFDSYGLGFEFAPLPYIRSNNDGLKFRPHHKWKTVPGQYSDDTQMAAALSRLFLSGQPMTHYTLAEYFFSEFTHSPRAGYNGKFYEILQEIQTPLEFLQKVIPCSYKSGGAMRAGPCGLYADETEVIDLAMRQASVTHATRHGMESAAASALMAHYAAYSIGPRKDLSDYVSDQLGSSCINWKNKIVSEVSSDGWQPVLAAMNILEKEPSLWKAMRKAVALGGDTDTTAAILGFVADLFPDHIDDIPQSLWETFEQGTHGITYLQALDNQLHEFLINQKAGNVSISL